jgi:DNA polymerase-3 subunit alpha
MVALYRPGPMQFIPDYIACLHGKKEPEYRHERLKPIFSDTFGIPVYQEQIMFAAMDLAGYTAAESDSLRKAISKKKKKDIELHRKKFIEGCIKNGIEEKTAVDIFCDWEQFANYGFNKSHAADYGVLAVQTGFLKTHYFIEYMTASLDANLSDSAKIAYYINECKIHGVDVLPPQINSSFWGFSVEDDPDGKSRIRFGMGAVKNVGQNAVEAIVEEREKNGLFQNLDDFAERLDLRMVGRRALECLIKVGAMDQFGERGSLLASLDAIINTCVANIRSKDSGQINLFDLMSIPTCHIQLTETPPVDNHEKLNWERELMGLFVSDHPLNAHLPILKLRKALTHQQLDMLDQGTQVSIGGMVQSMRMMLTKKDSRTMCSVKLEDIHGDLTDVLFYPKQWEKVQDIVKTDAVLIVEGRLDKSRMTAQVIGSSAQSLMVGEIPQAVAEFVDSFTNELEEQLDTDDIAVGDNMPSPGIYQNGTANEFDDTPEEPEVPWNQILEESGSSDIWPDVPLAVTNLPEKSAAIEGNQKNETVLKQEPVDSAEDEVSSGGSKIWLNQHDGLEIFRSDDENGKNDHPLDTSEQLAADSPKATAVSEIEPRLLENLEVEEEDDDDLIFPDTPKKKPKLLTIIIKQDQEIPIESVIRKMKRVHGLITSYPGRDRFAFLIQEGGKTNLLEFPDTMTNICEELLLKIRKEIGENNIQIEE